MTKWLTALLADQVCFLLSEIRVIIDPFIICNIFSRAASNKSVKVDSSTGFNCRRLFIGKNIIPKVGNITYTMYHGT